jgi:hypothetical protein
MEKKSTIQWSLEIWVALFALTGLLLAGCAAMAPEKPKVMIPTDRGTVLFLDKYEFKAPVGWFLMRNLEGGDFELGFVKTEPGAFPSQTTFMFDAEPYGSSPELEGRANQYCTRFLFNSGISAEVTKREKAQVMGLDALVLYFEGENPVQKEKAKSKLYLVKKGNRIISFVCTQWRPLDGRFDMQPFEIFDNFVQSFKFLKKTFYENLDEEIQKLKG